MNNDILNDARLISSRDKWVGRLKNLYDGKREETLVAVNGVFGEGKSDLFLEPEKWVEECVEDLTKNKAAKILNERQFVPICIEHSIFLYGVHYVDKILGANVYFKDGQWGCDYLKTAIGELKYPNIRESEPFLCSMRGAKKFVEIAGKLPFFGLPTIASALNVALNLYGEEILVAMHTEPEKARHDLALINRLLIELHQEFRKVIPANQLQPVVAFERTQPPNFGQLCGCSTQLISNEMYRDFIEKLDEDLLNVYENGGMIHLCGAHTQHIPSFKKMKSVRSLQLNNRAAADLEEYFNNLRADQIFYVNVCEEMPLERVMSITKGKRVVIAGIDMDNY